VILLLRGGDELAVRRRLQRLKDESDGGSGMLTANLIQVEGRDARAEDILGPALTPPFLAPQRLVVVERFLDRWQGRPAPEEQPEQADEEAALPRSMRQFETLFAGLEAGLPPTTVLVFTGGAAAASNAMAARLKKIPGVSEEVHEEPRKEDLFRFIRTEAAARGLRFRTARAAAEHWESEDWLRRPETDPVTLLAAVTNGATLAIANELDKLALYSMGREVTVDDVYRLCSGEREVTQFNLLDAVQDGKAAEALHHLDRLMAADDVSQYVLTMLTTRFRQTAMAAEQMEKGAPEEEVGRAMGKAGRHPGLRQAGMRRARAYGTAGARAALAAIAETDYRGKKNEVRHEVGLEVLVMRLAGMAAAGSRRGSSTRR
jgi:DNA polymerase III delta subunit